MSEFAALINRVKPNKLLSNVSLYKSGYINIENNSGIKLQKSINNQTQIVDKFENDKVLVVLKGYLLNVKNNGVAEYIGNEYLLIGSVLFSKLDGAFSLFIMDKVTNKVFLLTDPFGKENLYYSLTEENMFFSSSLSGVKVDLFIKKKVNKQAVNDFFTYYFIPAPLTIYEKVYKALPSELITFSFKDNNIKKEKYWTINKKHIEENDRQMKSELKDKIISNVDQLQKKFSVSSSFLSGGIDSTIISGILSDLKDSPIDTFTIGYEDNKVLDESNVAHEVSLHQKSNHHILNLNSSHLNEEYKNIIAKLDEPFADSSMIPTYFISKYAGASNITHLLGGDGGDELFAGYNRYDSIRYSNNYNKVPSIIKENLIEPISNFLPTKSNSKISNLNNKFKKLLSIVDGTPFEIYHRFLMMLPENKLTELLKSGKINNETRKRISNEFDFLSTNNNIDKMMYTDLFFNLPNDVLYKVMKMSNEANISTHSPLLEKELVNMSFSIPLKYKINKNDKKIIFKDIFKEHLPDAVLKSPKKGFGVPIGEWFRTDLKEDFLYSLERNKTLLEEYINYYVLEEYVEEHMLNRNDHSHLLWSVFVFVIWSEENL